MVTASDELMAALRVVRSLGLRSWCIGAGAIRSLIWDTLHKFDQRGLDDLFELRVRLNPLRASVATYRQRVAEKRFGERWPRLSISTASSQNAA